MGNHLISEDALFDSGVNPYSDVFTADEFRKIFPNTIHQFTGVDYIQFYKETCECPCEIILANDPKAILKYADNVIVASIHKRNRDKKILQQAGVKKVFCLDEILTELKYCGDNAAMVGAQGYYEFLKGNVASLDLNAYATMPIDE